MSLSDIRDSSYEGRLIDKTDAYENRPRLPELSPPGFTPHARKPSAAEAAEIASDTAKAFDQLQAWLEGSPSTRSVWAIDKINGRWRVGLMTGDERLSASQDAELRGAIRNAIMIAQMAGYAP